MKNEIMGKEKTWVKYYWHNESISRSRSRIEREEIYLHVTKMYIEWKKKNKLFSFPSPCSPFEVVNSLLSSGYINTNTRFKKEKNIEIWNKKSWRRRKLEWNTVDTMALVCRCWKAFSFKYVTQMTIASSTCDFNPHPIRVRLVITKVMSLFQL